MENFSTKTRNLRSQNEDPKIPAIRDAVMKGSKIDFLNVKTCVPLINIKNPILKLRTETHKQIY